MIRGLYTSASGMLAEAARNDVASNNLANVNTTGYKKETTVMASFPDMLLMRVNDRKKEEIRNPFVGTLGTGVLVDEVLTSHAQGQLKESSSAFDLAIVGGGYFAIETPAGERYTRNGNFTLSQDGYLVTNQGYFVLGQAGRIRAVDNDNKVVNMKDFMVDGSGNVSVNGQRIDTLRLVAFDNPAKQLTKQGDSLFVAAGQGNQAAAQVLQNFVETSNINPITEMVDLITIMRSYEANQKAIQAHDRTLEQVINDVGRIK